MTRGMPDWSDRRKNIVNSAVNDMGELAVRLWSPVAYDRRGDVLWLTDFRDGIAGWFTSAAGTGALADASTVHSLSAGVSAVLTGGSGVGDLTQIQRSIGYTAITPTGVATSVLVDPDLSYVALVAKHYDGSENVAYGWKYDNVAKALYRWIPLGGWAKVADADFQWADAPTWQDVKLAFDPATQMYKFLLSGRYAYDLSAYGGDVQPGGTPQALLLWYTAASQVGVNGSAYLDRVILTQNEP